MGKPLERVGLQSHRSSSADVLVAERTAGLPKTIDPIEIVISNPFPGVKWIKGFFVGNEKEGQCEKNYLQVFYRSCYRLDFFELSGPIRR
jgi:hypothetical protein